MAGVAALSLSGVRSGLEHAASTVEAGVSEGEHDPYATQRQMDRMNRRQQQQEDLAKKQQELEEEMRRLPVTARRFTADSRWLDPADDD